MKEVSICLKKLFTKNLSVPASEWSESISKMLRDELESEVNREAREMIARSNRGGWARLVNIGEFEEWDNGIMSLWSRDVPHFRGWQVFFYTGVARCLGARRVSGVEKHREFRKGDVIHVGHYDRG